MSFFEYNRYKKKQINRKSLGENSIGMIGFPDDVSRLPKSFVFWFVSC